MLRWDINIAKNVTAERVRRVSQGYTKTKGEHVEGLGGGFQFCKLSDEPLFKPDGQVRADVTFAQLAEFVWFVETVTGFTGKADSPLIGVHEGRAVYLLYNGILKDKSVAGGKTWLAAKSVALINTHLLCTEYSVILWLTPSKPIREQTLKALSDRQHPYAAALREAGPITVLDLEEAKNVTRATLETSGVVIVATRQAFQVEDEESRKVYESSGSLMHHFDNLSPVQRDELLRDGEIIPYSLSNVLRLRRPFVIVDEAHNSRTELAFDTLARFRPSGIMELTATPDTEKTPSNVLHSVSAAELKAEEMIKLPIVLETETNWQQCLADAIARRDELHNLRVNWHCSMIQRFWIIPGSCRFMTQG